MRLLDTIRNSLAQRRNLRLVLRSPYFDRDWYLRNNRDVAESHWDPAEHFLLFGGFEGRNPGPNFNCASYRRSNPSCAAEGANPLVHYHRRSKARGGAAIPAVPASDTGGRPLPALEPLPVRRIRARDARVTLVVDAIGPGAPFDGTATALVLATLWASHLDAALRIVTRTERIEQGRIGQLLQACGIAFDGRVEFAFAPPGTGRYDVDVGDRDVFLATSWRTVLSTLQSVSASRICYLVQEDERLLCTGEAERAQCVETLADPNLCIIVNTRSLYDHFVDAGFDNFAQRGVSFEPAFPDSLFLPGAPLYAAGDDGAPRRRHFFFYAHPGHPESLFARGQAALNAALRDGVLDPEKWQFHFVGSGLGEVVLDGGVRPNLACDLGAQDYAALVRRCDLGLSLMYTPHLSHPPLDLAAAGAIVVTNRLDHKRDLRGLSENIILADLDVDSIVDALREAVALADDAPRRRANFERSRIQRDWSTALEGVVGVLPAI